jgi:drug/metabolite transporter (DMT)-like permease
MKLKIMEEIKLFAMKINNILPSPQFFIYGLLPIFIWGIFPVITKSFKEINIGVQELFIGLIIFNIFTLGIINIYKYYFSKKYKNSNKESFKSIKKHLRPFLFYTLLGSILFLLYRSIYYYGLQNYNALIINSLNYSWVIFIFIISVIMNNTSEKINMYNFLSLLIGFIGILFIYELWNVQQSIDSIYFLMLLGSLFTAIEFNILLKIKQTIINDSILIYFSWFCFLFFILFFYYLWFYLFQGFLPFSIQNIFDNLWYLFIFSILFTLPMLLYLNLFTIKSHISTSFIGYFIPIIGNTLLIILFDYSLTINLIIGFTLILFSGILLNKFVKDKFEFYSKHFIYKYILKIK